MLKTNVLSGYWRTGSGAEYKITYESDYVIFIYWNPSPAQQAAGFVRGDLAYKGTLIGNVLVGTFFQRFPLTEKERCIGTWETPTVLYLQLSEDHQELSGTLLASHLPSDSCIIDDRRLVPLTFIRFVENQQCTEKKSAPFAKDEKFTSGG